MSKTVTERPLRVFVGPGETAGYYSALHFGLTSIGISADLFFYFAHPYGYSPLPPTTRLRRSIQWCAQKTRASGIAMRGVAYASLVPLLLLHTALAIFTYDAFIFGYGRSLLPRNLDLPLLRLFRRRIICNIAHGSESRPPYLSGSYRLSDGSLPPLATIRRQTRLTSARVRRIHRYADHVIGAPYTSHFAPGPQINLFAIGLPQVPPSEHVGQPGSVRQTTVDIRVLHAPSNPMAKGTHLIREAVDELRRNGLPIVLIEITGAANVQVIDAIRHVDFVVDQIYSDTPMAGFAAEAGRYGIPAVVGGYGLTELRKHIPEGMFPPSILCHPGELSEAIFRAANDADYRNGIGKAAQQFVSMQWSATSVARRYLTLISGDPPSDWVFNPGEVIYPDGMGQERDASKSMVRSLVDRFGSASLQLRGRVDLEAAILSFAGIGK